MRRLLVMTMTIGLLLAAPAYAAPPRYDVPPGFTRCPHAVAWHGFFKWASQRDTSCRAASQFMRRYAARADEDGMPRRVDGYRCRIHFWRNDEGDVYASRHVCARGDEVIRFYGMV
jgi:hypothetical protein